MAIYASTLCRAVYAAQVAKQKQATELATAGERDRLASIVKNSKKFALFKKDAFTGTTFIEPRDMPAYRKRNGIYCFSLK